MNDDFDSLYDFNRWADGLIVAACRNLTESQYTSELVPGWASIRSTMVHIALVTDIWLRRLTGEAVGRAGGELELPTLDDVAARLERAYQTYDALKPIITPEWLATPMTFTVRTWSGSLPPWIVLRHVVNHSTYHRGQVASKLGRLGLEPPMTDLFFWGMERFKT